MNFRIEYNKKQHIIKSEDGIPVSVQYRSTIFKDWIFRNVSKLPKNIQNLQFDGPWSDLANNYPADTYKIMQWGSFNLDSRHYIYGKAISGLYINNLVLVKNPI